MPRYKVMDGPKRHDGKRYEIGDEMEVSEEVAERLRLEPVEVSSSGSKSPNKSGGGAPPLMNSKEKLKMIGACETIEALDNLLEGETRQTIIEAAGKKRERIQIKAGAGN